MQLKGRPRLALHHPASLHLGPRLFAPAPCVLGPILSLRAPGAWPACGPDQLLLTWGESVEGSPCQLRSHPPGWHGHADLHCWCLVIPMEQLLLSAERGHRADRLVLVSHTELDRATPTNARLWDALTSLRAMATRGLSHDWLALEPVALELVVGALISGDGQGLPRRDRGWRHVIQALLCMDQGLAEDINLARLCRATGVSARALQMAFRRHLHKRPLQSLRELRLARLRHLLLQPGRRPGMAEAVVQCGLPGNGTTARHYGDRYGEKPSQTRC